jgi:O-antigen/teichoic acid export membrane protein
MRLLRPGAIDARTLRLLTVGWVTIVGRMGGALAPLVYVPLARETLDAERFGVWMLVSGLMGFLAFADLGVGYALLNRVTAVQAGEPAQQRQQLSAELTAGYACTAFLGLIVLLAWGLWWGLASDVSLLVGVVSAANQPDVATGIAVFAILFALNLPAGLIQKIQIGAQDGQWVGAAQFLASLLTLAALPVALALGGALWLLVVATLGVQLLVNLGSTAWWLQRRGCLGWGPPAAPHRGRVGALIRSGALFFCLQLVGALAFQSDAIVISHVLGPAAYGDFSVVQRLFLLIGAGLAAGTSGLWPAFGDALARGEWVWLRRTLVRAWYFTGAVALISVGALCLAMNLISVRWLHAASAPAFGLMLALAAWTLLEALGNVSAAVMNSANLQREQLVYGAWMAALAFGGKWWAVAAFGPTGAVMATLAAYLAVCVPGQYGILKGLLFGRKESPSFR